MTVYTAGRKAHQQEHASNVAKHMLETLNIYQGRFGMDGLDVVLGNFSAIRQFVLWNVGPEAIAQELKTLAHILEHGEAE